METKGSQGSLQSRLSFFHHGRLFSSDRDDSSDSDDYMETRLKAKRSVPKRPSFGEGVAIIKRPFSIEIDYLYNNPSYSSILIGSHL